MIVDYERFRRFYARCVLNQAKREAALLPPAPTPSPSSGFPPEIRAARQRFYRRCYQHDAVRRDPAAYELFAARRDAQLVRPAADVEAPPRRAFDPNSLAWVCHPNNDEDYIRRYAGKPVLVHHCACQDDFFLRWAWSWSRRDDGDNDPSPARPPLSFASLGEWACSQLFELLLSRAIRLRQANDQPVDRARLSAAMARRLRAASPSGVRYLLRLAVEEREFEVSCRASSHYRELLATDLGAPVMTDDDPDRRAELVASWDDFEWKRAQQLAVREPVADTDNDVSRFESPLKPWYDRLSRLELRMADPTLVAAARVAARDELAAIAKVTDPKRVPPPIALSADRRLEVWERRARIVIYRTEPQVPAADLERRRRELFLAFKDANVNPYDPKVIAYVKRVGYTGALRRLRRPAAAPAAGRGRRGRSAR